MEARSVVSAIDRASNFIAATRSPDGMWRDFQTLAGRSCDWVTGFTAHSLVQAGRRDDLVQAAGAALLARRRANGGWAYNELVPTDCDSTAWILLLLASIPPPLTASAPAVREARAYVKSHQSAESGGFSTYSANDGIDEYIGAADGEAATQGWLSSHPCVSAVAVQSLLASGDSPAGDSISAAISYLLAAQRSGYVWQSYWWQGYGYCTYHALQALRLTGAWGTRYDTAVSFVLAHQHRDGGWDDVEGQSSQAFATAWMILTLLLEPSNEGWQACERAAAWLLKQQLPQGGWSTVPILRIPPPTVSDAARFRNWQSSRKGAGAVIRDDVGIFTAAAVMWALSVFCSHYQG